VIVRAHWYVYPPDAPRADERKTLVTDNDVDDLVAALSAPHVDDAYLTTNEPGAFVIHLALRDSWGYLAWTDDEFLGSPAGDPNSPGTHGTFNTDYFPGTGVPTAILARVLKDLLATGSRPTSVEWVSDDELETAATEDR
jgi:Immunity protein Imm1